MKKLNIRKKYSEAKHTGVEYIKDGSNNKTTYAGGSNHAPLIMRIAPSIEISISGALSNTVNLLNDGLIEFKALDRPCHLCVDWGDGVVENRTDLPQNFSHEYGSAWTINDTLDIKIYSFDKSIKTVFNWAGETEKKAKRIKDIISWGNPGYSKLPSFTNLQLDTEYTLHFPADTFKGFEGVTEFDEELYLYNARIDPDFWKYVPSSSVVKTLIYGYTTTDFTTLFKNITGKFPNLETVEDLLYGALEDDEPAERIQQLMDEAGEFLAAQTKLVNVPYFFDTGSWNGNHPANIPDTIANKSFENLKNFFNDDDTFKFVDENIPDHFLANSPNLWNIAGLFNRQERITKLPNGLFSNKPKLRNLKESFEKCKRITALPESFNTVDWGGPDKNPGVIMYQTFKDCEKLTGIVPKLWEIVNPITGTKVIDGEGCFEECNRITNGSEIPYPWEGNKLDRIPVVRSLEINGKEDLVVETIDTTVKVHSKILPSFEVYSPSIGSMQTRPKPIIKYWIGTDKTNLTEVQVNWEAERPSQEYFNIDIDYTLQWAEGPQTIYFKVASEIGESEIYARQVQVLSKEWRLDSFSIAGAENFAGIYDSEHISIVPNIIGSRAIPQRYMISLDANFTDATWTDWDGQNIPYTLPYTAEGDSFTVYLKMQDDYSYTSDTKSLAIQVNKLPIIKSFLFNDERYRYNINVTNRDITAKVEITTDHLYNYPVTHWVISNKEDETNYNLGNINSQGTGVRSIPYHLTGESGYKEKLWLKVKNQNGEVKDSRVISYSWCPTPTSHEMSLTNESGTTRDRVVKVSSFPDGCSELILKDVSLYDILACKDQNYLQFFDGSEESFLISDLEIKDGYYFIPFRAATAKPYIENHGQINILAVLKNNNGESSYPYGICLYLGFQSGNDYVDQENLEKQITTTKGYISFPLSFYRNTTWHEDPNNCFIRISETLESIDNASWIELLPKQDSSYQLGWDGTFTYILPEGIGEKTLYIQLRINDCFIYPIYTKKVIVTESNPITQLSNIQIDVPEVSDTGIFNIKLNQNTPDKELINDIKVCIEGGEAEASWIEFNKTNGYDFTLPGNIENLINTKYNLKVKFRNRQTGIESDWIINSVAVIDSEATIFLLNNNTTSDQISTVSVGQDVKYKANSGSIRRNSGVSTQLVNVCEKNSISLVRDPGQYVTLPLENLGDHYNHPILGTTEVSTWYTPTNTDDYSIKFSGFTAGNYTTLIYFQSSDTRFNITEDKFEYCVYDVNGVQQILTFNPTDPYNFKENYLLFKNIPINADGILEIKIPKNENRPLLGLNFVIISKSEQLPRLYDTPWIDSFTHYHEDNITPSIVFDESDAIIKPDNYSWYHTTKQKVTGYSNIRKNYFPVKILVTTDEHELPFDSFDEKAVDYISDHQAFDLTFPNIATFSQTFYVLFSDLWGRKLSVTKFVRTHVYLDQYITSTEIKTKYPFTYYPNLWYCSGNQYLTKTNKIMVNSSEDSADIYKDNTSDVDIKHVYPNSENSVSFTHYIKRLNKNLNESINFTFKVGDIIQNDQVKTTNFIVDDTLEEKAICWVGPNGKSNPIYRVDGSYVGNFSKFPYSSTDDDYRKYITADAIISSVSGGENGIAMLKFLRETSEYTADEGGFLYVEDIDTDKIAGWVDSDSTSLPYEVAWCNKPIYAETNSKDCVLKFDLYNIGSDFGQTFSVKIYPCGGSYFNVPELERQYHVYDINGVQKSLSFNPYQNKTEYIEFTGLKPVWENGKPKMIIKTLKNSNKTTNQILGNVFEITFDPIVNADFTSIKLEEVITDKDVYSRDVVLTVPSCLADEILISEDSNFTGATWIKFEGTHNFTLSEGVGEKIVYVKVRNTSLSLESNSCSVTINYQDTPPPGV